MVASHTLKASSTCLDNLNTIQNMYLRITTSAYRTTRTDSLLNDACECLLNVRRQFMSTLPAFNIKVNTNFTAKIHYILPVVSFPTSIKTLLLTESRTLKIPHNKINLIPPWHSFQPTLDLSLIKFSKKETNQIVTRRNVCKLL